MGVTSRGTSVLAGCALALSLVLMGCSSSTSAGPATSTRPAPTTRQTPHRPTAPTQPTPSNHIYRLAPSVPLGPVVSSTPFDVRFPAGWTNDTTSMREKLASTIVAFTFDKGWHAEITIDHASTDHYGGNATYMTDGLAHDVKLTTGGTAKTLPPLTLNRDPAIGGWAPTTVDGAPRDYVLYLVVHLGLVYNIDIFVTPDKRATVVRDLAAMAPTWVWHS